MSIKIGIGLITCDRPHFVKKSLERLLTFSLLTENNAELVVIDDGNNSAFVDHVPENIKYIKTSGRTGVAKAKNLALTYLLEKKCTDFFILEDDIEILNEEVFSIYIETSKKTGIQHFNYGLHGNHNRDNKGNAIIKQTIEYPDNVSIDLYGNLLGALSYFTKECLNEVGLLDENFYNAMEHVDHTYQIIKKNHHPPFRWFADIRNSEKYIKDIVEDHKESIIRSESNFQQTFKNGLDQFIKKNHFSVAQGYGPPEKFASLEEVKQSLKNIWKQLSEK